MVAARLRAGLPEGGVIARTAITNAETRAPSRLRTVSIEPEGVVLGEEQTLQIEYAYRPGEERR
jgi:hypothetical protein